MEQHKVLVLGKTSTEAKALCDCMESSVIQAVAAQGPADAVHKLREAQFSLFLVDATMEKPPVLDFLAKARQALPKVPRALYAPRDANLNLDFPALIQRASPCAWLDGEITSDDIEELIERNRKALPAPVRQAPAAPPPPPQRAASPQAPMGKPRKATGPNVGADMPSYSGNPFADAVQNAQEEKAAARKDTVAIKAERPDHKKEGREMPEDPIEHANKKIEFDLMADDTCAEVARILDLMIEQPGVQLPALPQVATEVRKLLAKDDVSFEQIAEVVSVDPSMSARILEVANSPMYAGIEKTRNLQQAVSRIGMRETRNILQAVSAENLFTATKDKRINTLMTKLWMHSLACAYSNEILAQDLFIEESSDFFMMGLLHDIGKLVILHLIQEGYDKKIWTKKNITDDLIDELFEKRHNVMGARLLMKWDYDKSFLDVVFFHNDDDQKVRFYDEPIVVTFFSNLLTRKMGFSLLPYPENEDPLSGHEIAQALNMSPDVRERIETRLHETVQKIKQSFSG